MATAALLGLWVQLTTGVGYVHTSASVRGHDQAFSDTTLGLGAMIGGRPRPRLVLGGALWVDRAGSPSVEQDGAAVPAELTQYVYGLGAFVDHELANHPGWHVQGLAGWGGLETASVSGNAGDADPSGPVFALTGGRRWAVARSFALGVVVRLAYGRFELEDVSYATWAPAVLATFTWH